MEIKSGKATEIWGRKFRIVKNGLDEREVSSFVGSLVDQNNEYAGKLKHLDSLIRLAENTVIEADQLAESIKIEAEEEASEKAKEIITQAEEQSRAEAEKKAEAEAEDIIARAKEKARAEAEEIIAEAENTSREKVSTAEQQAQHILKTAEETAEQIKAPAEKEAARIVSEAKQEAEQFLMRTRKVAESELREKLRAVYREMLSTLDLEDMERPSATAMEQELAVSEPHELEAAVLVPAEAESREPQVGRSVRQEEAESESRLGLEAVTQAKAEVKAEEPRIEQPPITETRVGQVSPDLYKGTVELTLRPPLGLEPTLQLHRHLKSVPMLEVLNLGVTIDKGLKITVLFQVPIPLRQVLEGLPGVERIEEVGQATSPQEASGKPRVREFMLTMRKRALGNGPC